MTYTVLFLDLQLVCDELLCGTAIWPAPLQRDPCDAGTHQPRSVGQVGQTSSRVEDHLRTKATDKQERRQKIIYIHTHSYKWSCKTARNEGFSFFGYPPGRTCKCDLYKLRKSLNIFLQKLCSFASLTGLTLWLGLFLNTASICITCRLT